LEAVLHETASLPPDLPRVGALDALIEHLEMVP